MKPICLEYDEENKCVAGEALQSAQNTAAFRRKNSKVSITDGSYAETKVTAPPAFSAQNALTRQLARSGAGLHCPRCGSIIYSRRHNLCGVCAHELPVELLFPKEEAERVECLLRHEQRRHRTWMAKTFHQALAASFLPRSLR